MLNHELLVEKRISYAHTFTYQYYIQNYATVIYLALTHTTCECGGVFISV